MVKQIFSVLCAGTLLAVAAHAQPENIQVKQSWESQVEFYATNTGIFALDTAKDTVGAGFIVPRGSKTGYLYGSGLWFGTKKNVKDSMGMIVPSPLVFFTYNPLSLASWATPGEGYVTVNPDKPLARPDLYVSTDYDRMTGLYNRPIVPPVGTGNWPLWLSYGKFPVPMNPGLFVPFNMDRAMAAGYSAPAFMPGVEEQFVARYHDADLTQYKGISTSQARMNGYPIGLQIEQNIYAWRQGRYQHVVVLQYEIVNMSTDTLFDCVVAEASDPDMGKEDNDHVRYYAERPDLRSAMAWTDPEPGSDFRPLAMVLLEAPVVNEYGVVDNSQRQRYRNDGRIGTFPRWTFEENQTTSAARYDFMRSGMLTDDLGAADLRALLASTMFTMLPGDTAHFAVAFAVLDGTFGKTRKSEDPPVVTKSGSDQLEHMAATVIDDYYGNTFLNLISSSINDDNIGAHVSVGVIPNPARGSVTIRYGLAERSDISLHIVNSLGQEMLSRPLGNRAAGAYDEHVDVASLPTGAYMAVIRVGGRMLNTRFSIIR
ncbi:MAG: T9SS type A sorting domain-containing protein [Candidatus Kapaibacterium sp.]